MPAILLCGPMMSQVPVGGMAEEAELSAKLPLHFVGMRQMAAEEQSGRTADDMEVHMKQRGENELFHVEKMTPIDTH